MNKIKKQMDYFKVLNNVLCKYPNLSSNDLRKVVLSVLVRIGVPIEERKNDVSPNFEKWVDRFENFDNIIAETDDDEKICKFENRNDKFDDDSAIKLFVPMDSIHIYYGVEKIFSYLAQENISHVSKVKDKITSDNIEIKVNSLTDALKITRFIISNEYIKEGLILPNPFLENKDGIVYTMDGKEDCNLILSDLITKYTLDKLKRKEIQDIQVNDFKMYLKEMDEYNKVNDENVNDDKNNLLKLFLLSVNSNNSYEELEKFINIRKSNYLGTNSNSDVLKEAIEVLVDKYGKEVAVKQLNKYIEIGDSNKFSKDDYSRDKVELYLNKEIVQNIISNVCMGKIDTNDYVDYIMNEDIDEEKLSILEEISISTYKKHGNSGSAQLGAALKHLVEKGEYSFFDSQLEPKLKHNIKPRHALEIMKRQLVNDHLVKDENNINNPIELYTMDIERKVKSSINKYQGKSK